MRDVQAALSDFPLPPGYQIGYAGENEEQQKAIAFLSKAFLVALAGIALILITQFNSLTPALCHSHIRCFVFDRRADWPDRHANAFWDSHDRHWRDQPCGRGGQQRHSFDRLYLAVAPSAGLSAREAIIRAGVVRFRPVILTAMTTILGLLPLATGISFDFFTFSWEIGGRSSQWWGPMGVAVIFGLAFATALTLVIVPVLISLIWRWFGTPEIESTAPTAPQRLSPHCRGLILERKKRWISNRCTVA